MTENRLPPGYVPLTIHELNAQPNRQGPRNRPDGDRPRRHSGSGGSSKPRGRVNNSNNNSNSNSNYNRRPPRREEDQEPNDE